METQTHTTFEDARLVLKTLIEAGHQSMFAGGCVRDRLLGITPKDFDIATEAPPEVTSKIFSERKFKVIPTGIGHGTVTILTRSGPVEVTTLRHDVKTDGRRALVEFTGASFESDAARRDFTINAMFEDFSGVIHDFHHGQRDLKDKILRFVGNPEQRIREDYLRILRFFRFLARFGFSPDPLALTAIASESQGIKQVSQERIAKELWGIFAAKQASQSLQTMKDTGVLSIILPNHAPFDSIAPSIAKANTLEDSIRPWAVFVLLLGLNQPQALLADSIKNLSKYLRFSEADGNTLVDLMVAYRSLEHVPRETAGALDLAEYLEARGNHYTLRDFYVPIWTLAAEEAHDRAKIEIIKWLVSTDQQHEARRKKPMPLTGHDVIALSPKSSGQALGPIMKELKRAYRNGLWRDKNSGLEFLKVLLQNFFTKKGPD